ncbi:MAG: hypothetical protein JNL39_01135, partial [Opitutaceae bacterium]|nr:hypothetical protein [Opitutaceae bacterium]
MSLSPLRAALLVCSASVALAEVTRVEITQRADIGASGYEKLTGRIHFAIDPKHTRNRLIADVDLAPLNARRRVEFSADFFALKPKDAAKGNGTALVEVSNRGRRGLLRSFSRA